MRVSELCLSLSLGLQFYSDRRVVQALAYLSNRLSVKASSWIIFSAGGTSIVIIILKLTKATIPQPLNPVEKITPC